MATDSLREFLTAVIVDHLGDHREAPKPDGTERSIETRRSLLPQAAKIAEELISQALSSGLPLTHMQTEDAALGGGNTAETVARLTVHAPFAFKLDQAESKLAAEGSMMRQVRSDARLPAKFREAWPVIYAVRDNPPYAYLMEFFPKEEGWLSLEDRLFPVDGRLPASPSEAVRMIQSALDVLFAGFGASVNPRNLPSLRQDYVQRIRSRLMATVAADERFASIELTVNGDRLKPWQHYLESIDRNAAYLESIAPAFSTVTHGDPNPGNLMLRTTVEGVELKLIDPKDWLTGDYLFDLTKITHFLESTGPVEKGNRPAQVNFQRVGSSCAIDYAFESPRWKSAVVDVCLERIEQFSAEHGDLEWRARYELGMAANLLGLPLGRLTNKKRPRPEAALILYAEGMRWLARFCARIPSRNVISSPGTEVADATTVEPHSLRRVREFVRERAPGVQDSQDRRGFRLLQWAPQRDNDAKKPAELSLEHEARLAPINEQALARLVAALSTSEGRTLGERVLPGSPQFESLIVRRYDRAVGAQSIDRYYDTHPRGSLILRMMTFRERVKTTEFMTWRSSDARAAPLNLELPFVSLGDCGIVARLEFNWIDEPNAALGDLLAHDWRSPVCLAAGVLDVSFEGARPVLEHTTYRQKFAVCRPALAGEPGQTVFDINIDHVVAQSLESKRLGGYVDVDISAHAPIDTTELGRLTTFVTAIAARFELQAVSATKAWRDARVTGLI